MIIIRKRKKKNGKPKENKTNSQLKQTNRKTKMNNGNKIVI